MKTKRLLAYLLAIVLIFAQFICVCNITAFAIDDVPPMVDTDPRFDIFEGVAFEGTFGSTAITGQGHLPGYSPAQKTFAAGSISGYDCFEFDFYLDDISVITARNIKLYLNLRSGSGSGASRGSFEFQNQLTASGWNHIKVKTDLTGDIFSILTMARFYIDIDAGDTGADDSYVIANVCATGEQEIIQDEYNNIPAMVQSVDKFTICEGAAFAGTFGSTAITGQGHLPGYSPAQKTFAAGSVANHDCFEFDFYLDDISIIAARNTKLYLNLRSGSGAGSSLGTYGFEDQLTTSGWNHVRVKTDMPDGKLEILTMTRFYIDIDAGETGATDRYRIANICATRDEYNNVPTLLNSNDIFVIFEGAAFEGTLGNAEITGQGHLPGYGGKVGPAQRVFDAGSVSDYSCFEFDYYVDDFANFTARNIKLYLNLRAGTGSGTSKGTFEFQNQIIGSGWNHIRIMTNFDSEVLGSLTMARFYIDIDAGEAGETDRYRIANIIAADDPYVSVPSIAVSDDVFAIYEGVAFEGVLGDTAITGQGHLPGYSPAQKTFDNPGLSAYDYFEFDYYVDDFADFTARNTKLYFNLRSGTGNGTSEGIIEFGDQITASGWNHIKIKTDLDGEALDSLTIARFYIDIDAGEKGAAGRYRVANICAKKDAYNKVPAMPSSGDVFVMQEGVAFEGTLGSTAITGQGHLPGYSPAQKIFTNPGLSDYECFEFDYYIDDFANFTARNIKLYLNLRAGTGSGISKGSFEFQDQITASGWNHIKIATDLDSDVLDSLTMARFYIDIDAGEKGAADRYRVANIYCSKAGSHTHKVGDWLSDENYHWHVCTECTEILDKTEHTASDWIVDVQATAEAAGHKYKECTVCGMVLEEETIPKLITHTPGDINDDGIVNNKDLTRLFQYLSNWEVEVDEAALDITGDGAVNNKDLIRLFKYLSSWNVDIF